MRWKLLLIASLVAALISCGLWSALVLGTYGTARDFASHDWRLISSAIIPLAIAAYSGVFVYRHTARRRKTQATLTAIAALLLTLVLYLAAWAVFSDRFYIPRAYEDRHAR